MASNTIKVSFKVTGGSQFTLDVDPSWTVLQLKEKCKDETDIPVASQRLIYKGRILKDNDIVDAQGVKEGHIMHLVRSAASATTPAVSQPTNPSSVTNSNSGASNNNNTSATSLPSTDSGMNMGGMPNPQMDPFLQAMMGGGIGGGDGMAGMGGIPGMGGMGGLAGLSGMDMAAMMQNPVVQRTMQSISQNPQMLRGMMEANPMFRPMLPMMQGLFDNPELMRTVFNPQMMQASLQMQQALQQQQNAGGGGASGSGAQGTEGSNTANPFAAFSGMGGAGGMMPDMAAFAQAQQAMRQNPELMQQVMQAFSGGLQGAGAVPSSPNGSTGVAQQQVDTRPREERYAAQLLIMNDMGFIDRDANLDAIEASGGDVNAAITSLLERGFGN